MRIAIVAPPWLSVPPVAYGGTETVLDTLARGLKAAGHDVLLCTTGDSACDVERTWVFDHAVGVGNGGAVSEIRHVIHSYQHVFDADIVHDHTLVGPIYAASRPEVVVVTTNHGPFNEDLIDFYRTISNRIPIIAISRHQARTAGTIPIAATIHHGVEVEHFPVGTGSGGYAAFLGRMHPGKGVDVAARVARKAGYPLHIAGKMSEPAEIEYFESRVRPLLGGNIVYLGELNYPDKIEFLGNAACLLNPIVWPEPFGMVMIESLVCGTPVITTHNGAAPEIVEDGIGGFVCSGERQLADALQRIPSIDRTRCRSIVAERFSAQKMVNQHVELYESVLAQRHSPLRRVPYRLHDPGIRMVGAMTDGRILTGSPNSSGLAASSVTLVEGTTFAISSANGDIESDGAQGLFFDDTRFVSCWRMRLNGEELQDLGVIQGSPFDASFVTRSKPLVGKSDSTLVVVRSRFVGNGMREDVTIRNLDRESAACELSFDIEADFAHIFDVKDARDVPLVDTSIDVESASISFSYEHEAISRRLEVKLPENTTVKSGHIIVELIVPARHELTVCFEFRLEVNGQQTDLRHPCGEPIERSTPAIRLRAWEALAPKVHSGSVQFDATIEQSVRDLGALRIFDPIDPERVSVAAGAPWFMTLFGRDSLITAMMTLAVDQTLASGTLLTLARLQGQKVDPLTEEEPGRILHELRHGLPSTRSELGGSVYYGSIDSTPLFVMALGELYRWGLSEDLLLQLLPYADRALQWIDEFGDRDGDGFIEYQRATGRGLINQGWKDSFDGINFASGRLADPPIALCEVQAYVYAALLARATIARGMGDENKVEIYERRASALKGAFNDRFWLSDRGYFALGLDFDKRPIDSLTSNIGHCLWTGIVDDEKAPLVAQQLLEPEMFTGWGIRTLASSMGAYNPVSYHNGSVWPHDSAIAAAGLMRYGFVRHAHEVTLGLLSAAEHFGGRLPELLCGFDRNDIPVPIRYPTSCSPQAWSSAAPLWLLRTTLLQLDPSLPENVVRITPSIPSEIGSISVENLSIGGNRISIKASTDSAAVAGLPGGVELVQPTNAGTGRLKCSAKVVPGLR